MNIGDSVSPKTLGLPVIGELVGIIAYKFIISNSKVRFDYYHPFVKLYPNCLEDCALWGIVEFKEQIRYITKKEFEKYFYPAKQEHISKVENGLLTLRELYEQEVPKKKIILYPLDELGTVFD